jgi:hypothetical protein
MRHLFLVLVGLMAVSTVAGCGSVSSKADGGGGAGGGATGGGSGGAVGTGGAIGGAGGGTAGTGGAIGGRGGSTGTGGATGGTGGGATGGRGGSTGTGGATGGTGGGATGGRGGSTGTGGATGGTGGGAAGGRGGAGDTGGAGGMCAFASTYTLTDGMGLAGADSGTLTPPDLFHIERNTFGRGDAGRQSCDPPLPSCNNPDRIDVRDVEVAIAHPDVQAALALATPPIYGNTGIADGPSFSFRRADGRGFNTELDCTTPSTTCKPIPPGIKTLVDLLRMLLRQGQMDPACTRAAN